MEKKNLKDLLQALGKLDKKAEELDNALQDVRVAINNVLWELIELRKNRTESGTKKDKRVM